LNTTPPETLRLWLDFFPYPCDATQESRPDLSRVIRGAREVASQAFMFRSLGPYARPALVNGAVGVVVAPEGKPFSVLGFTVSGGKIVEIDAIGDPDRLARLDLAFLDA